MTHSVVYRMEGPGGRGIYRSDGDLHDIAMRYGSVSQRNPMPEEDGIPGDRCWNSDTRYAFRCTDAMAAWWSTRGQRELIAAGAVVKEVAIMPAHVTRGRKQVVFDSAFVLWQGRTAHV